MAGGNSAAWPRCLNMTRIGELIRYELGNGCVHVTEPASV